MTFEEPHQKRVPLTTPPKKGVVSRPRPDPKRTPEPQVPKNHEMPGLDKQNRATLESILGRGSVGYAEGYPTAVARHDPDTGRRLVFDPGTLFVPTRSGSR